MFSLLTLLDDIATTFDDVAVMTKLAMKKTSVLMSDDLAVNADVVHGVKPNRELPMVWAIFVGSLINKVYCVIGVTFLMATYPPILKVILLIGGLYLCYEGAHSVVEKFFRKSHDGKLDSKLQVSEKQKVKGAIRTDLILSIEIMVIAKGSVTGPLVNQVLTLIVIGLAASVIIYGLVGILVKVDDFGLYLTKKNFKKIGSFLVSSMPYIMKTLSVVGTAAMFLVGGGIIAHTFHFHNYIPEIIQNLLIGIVAGFICSSLIGLLPKKSH